MAETRRIALHTLPIRCCHCCSLRALLCSAGGFGGWSGSSAWTSTGKGTDTGTGQLLRLLGIEPAPDRRELALVSLCSSKEALAALPRAPRPVMCFSCTMWICAGRAASLRLPASLCELISSAGEQMRAFLLACARGARLDSTRRPAIKQSADNQFYRRPCDM